MDKEPDQEELDSYYDQAAGDGCLIVATLLTLWIIFAPFVFGG